MKKTFVVICILAQSVLSAQFSTDVRITMASSSQSCYNVELDYHGENEAKLASQNYRIFYNALAAEFDLEKSKSMLPEEDYLFSVVQTNHDIDASGVGPLSFEGHLGFINATVLLNDTRLDGLRLSDGNGWKPTIQLCFNNLDKDESLDIVLARKDLTGTYGRAFVELSIVDRFDAVQSLPIDSYQDLEP